MAAGKKSFILYADYLATVSKLTDAQAGKLFKLILEYVNDKDPKIENILLQIAFEPIKQNLKRDLKEWEAERSKRSEAGKIGGIKSGESRRSRSKRSNASKNEANEAVNVNENVIVNVNDNVNEREIHPNCFWQKEEEKKRSLLDCMNVALNDLAWLSTNKTNKMELEAFNEYLTRTGETEKGYKDYKKHFSNLKAKSPEKLKTKKTVSIEDYRRRAEEEDKKQIL